MDDVTMLLERLADEGTPRGASAVMHGARQSLLVEAREVPRPKPEWRARRVLLVAGAVVLVAVLVASVVVVARDTNPPANVLPAISDTATYRDLYDTSDQSLDGPLHLAPGYVPDGFSVLRVDDPASGAVSAGSASVDRFDTFARFDAAGDRVAETFTVQWGPGGTAVDDHSYDPRPGQDDDPLEGYRGQGRPTTVRGVEGLERSSEQGSFVAWEEPPGRMVAVSSESVSTTELAAIAEALVPAAGGGFEVALAPEGFVQIASQPGMASSGSPARALVYSDTAGRGFVVHVADHTQFAPGANLTPPPGPFGDNRIVDVNGRHAVVGARMNTGVGFDLQTGFLGNPDHTVQWLAPGNTLVTVIAKGLSEADALAIARGLRAVDPSEWARVHAAAPGRVGATPADLSQPEPVFSGDEEQIAEVFRTFIGGPDLDTRVLLIEDGEALRETLSEEPNGQGSQSYSARVDRVQLVDDTHAVVTYSLVANGSVLLSTQQGEAVKVDGTWKMSRASYCALVARGGITCPPG